MCEALSMKNATQGGIMIKPYQKPTIFSEQTFESSALACGKSVATPYGYVWTVTQHHTGSSHSSGSGDPYVSMTFSYSDGAYCGYADVEPNNMYSS